MRRAEIVPGPLVENVIRRVSPRWSVVASSLRLTNVSVAVGSPGTDWLAGVLVGAAWLGPTAAVGLAGGALGGACEGDALLGADDGAAVVDEDVLVRQHLDVVAVAVGGVPQEGAVIASGPVQPRVVSFAACFPPTSWVARYPLSSSTLLVAPTKAIR